MMKVGKEKLALAVPKVRAAGSLGIKPFGQSATSAPDTMGDLRRARQMLAGTPTAVRTRVPKIPMAPNGLNLTPRVKV